MTSRIWSQTNLYLDVAQRVGSIIYNQQGGTNGVFVGNGNNSIVAQVTNAGAFSQTSDDKVKFYKIEIVNGLEIINKLQPKHYIQTFKPTDNPDTDGWMECGSIAQEVEQLEEFKHSVTKPFGDHELYSLNYGQILPFLISAVKELSNRLSVLEQT